MRTRGNAGLGKRLNVAVFGFSGQLLPFIVSLRDGEAPVFASFCFSGAPAQPEAFLDLGVLRCRGRIARRN